MHKLATTLLVVSLIVSGRAASASPCIGITSVPPYGIWNGSLSGMTIGADRDTQRVAVYLFLPGQGWYTKPYFDPRCTPIQQDGSWSCLVTTGGIDHLATMFAAYLIPSSACDDPDIIADGLPCVPMRVQELALDYDIRAREKSGQRIISFAGYEWLVKSSDDGKIGPGPNYFSDSTDNVWVDEQGRLHLKMTFADGKWWCAEVICRHPLGYGTYRFYLDGPVDDLDANVVLGLFTYSDECSRRRDACVSAHREIDIEFARWGDPNNPTNAQFVVQEYECGDHVQRFSMPTGVAQSTNAFTWSEGVASFVSARGHSRTPASEDILCQWVFPKPDELPDPGMEQARINLYLIGGQPPLNGVEREVVISGFEFATSVPHAKSRKDGTPLSLEQKPVSAVWPGRFYVQEDERSSGLRIESPGASLEAGVRADAFGVMGTNADGERYLEATWLDTAATVNIAPLGMVNKAIGGADFRRRCFTTEGQSGVQDAHGLNNIGLLIRTWGTVTDIGEGLLYINDGSDLADGSGSIGVRVICDTTGYAAGDTVEVTGISSCFKDGLGRIARRILTRGPEDVRKAADAVVH